MSSWTSDRGVREEAEQRTHPLAARGPAPVEGQVVADHLVEPVGRAVTAFDQTQDLLLGLGDEQGGIDCVGHGQDDSKGR